MELGEPDASGRPSPRPLPGTEQVLDVDTVIEAIGTAPNPTMARTARVSSRTIEATSGRPETQMTSMPGVFAGGDRDRLGHGDPAMGAGRRAQPDHRSPRPRRGGRMNIRLGWSNTSRRCTTMDVNKRIYRDDTSITETDTLEEAARRMHGNEVGSLVVLDGD